MSQKLPFDEFSLVIDKKTFRYIFVAEYELYMFCFFVFIRKNIQFPKPFNGFLIENSSDGCHYPITLQIFTINYRLCTTLQNVHLT